MSSTRTDRAPIEYLETPPSPGLAPWVEGYWTLRARMTPAGANRVLPDACADIIVDVGAGAPPFVVGTMRTALVVPFADRVDLFGVRFRPGGALAFLDVPLAELTDTRVALDTLWGRMADTLADAIRSRPPADRVRAAEQVLVRRAPTVMRDAEMTARAVALFRQARGSVGVRETAGALGVSERRLERAFAVAIGLRPKELARVMRFRWAVQRIQAGSATSWSALAFSAGYSDQPHLIREFRQLAGVTPRAYALERGAVGIVQYEDPTDA